MYLKGGSEHLATKQLIKKKKREPEGKEAINFQEEDCSPQPDILQ